MDGGEPGLRLGVPLYVASKQVLQATHVVRNVAKANGHGMELSPCGSVVVAVVPFGPAAAAGIRPGMRITQVGGKAVSTANPALIELSRVSSGSFLVATETQVPRTLVVRCDALPDAKATLHRVAQGVDGMPRWSSCATCLESHSGKWRIVSGDTCTEATAPHGGALPVGRWTGCDGNGTLEVHVVAKGGVPFGVHLPKQRDKPVAVSPTRPAQALQGATCAVAGSLGVLCLSAHTPREDPEGLQAVLRRLVSNRPELTDCPADIGAIGRKGEARPVPPAHPFPMFLRPAPPWVPVGRAGVDPAVGRGVSGGRGKGSSAPRPCTAIPLKRCSPRRDQGGPRHVAQNPSPPKLPNIASQTSSPLQSPERRQSPRRVYKPSPPRNVHRQPHPVRDKGEPMWEWEEAEISRLVTKLRKMLWHRRVEKSLSSTAILLSLDAIRVRAEVDHLIPSYYYCWHNAAKEVVLARCRRDAKAAALCIVSQSCHLALRYRRLQLWAALRLFFKQTDAMLPRLYLGKLRGYVERRKEERRVTRRLQSMLAVTHRTRWRRVAGAFFAWMMWSLQATETTRRKTFEKECFAFMTSEIWGQLPGQRHLHLLLNLSTQHYPADTVALGELEYILHLDARSTRIKQRLISQAAHLQHTVHTRILYHKYHHWRLWVRRTVQARLKAKQERAVRLQHLEEQTEEMVRRAVIQVLEPYWVRLLTFSRRRRRAREFKRSRGRLSRARVLLEEEGLRSLQRSRVAQEGPNKRGAQLRERKASKMVASFILNPKMESTFGNKAKRSRKSTLIRSAPTEATYCVCHGLPDIVCRIKIPSGKS